MKIIDSHTHLGFEKPREDIKKCIDSAGIAGVCVFSSPPREHNIKIGKDFKERLFDVLNFTAKYKDILFPVLWIHPYEEDIFQKIDIAVKQKISAFKIICSNFYIYEDKAVEVLKYIAALKKPVFFHSGILWDGKDSSKYNRPANWEALIDIKGLKFSMGHCSWPWTDECIAVYGKFLNALGQNDGAEMFLDITPGTPLIYRKDLLTKLFTVGYDVGSNIFFGTDCNAEAYNSKWAADWINTDKEILDGLGVSKKVLENLYYNNIMRFLGKGERKEKIHIPTTDNANSWSPLCDD